MTRGDKPVVNQEEEQVEHKEPTVKRPRIWEFQELGILAPKPEILPPERRILWGPTGFSSPFFY